MQSRSPRIAVIPARYGSTRFPGKPLALLGGKPLIVHVLQRVRQSALFDRICVATDDARIASVVQVVTHKPQPIHRSSRIWACALTRIASIWQRSRQVSQVEHSS